MGWEAKVWEELLSVGRAEAEWGQGGGRATGVQRQGKGSWGHTTQSGERARAWPDGGESRHVPGLMRGGSRHVPGLMRVGSGHVPGLMRGGERAHSWPDERGERARAWSDGATGEEGPCQGAVWSRAHIPTSLQPDPSPLPWVALPCVLGELVTDAIGSLTELPAP